MSARLLDTKAHRSSAKCGRALHDARIVGVHHQQISRARALDDLGLCVGNPFLGFEVSDMGIADVEPHADFWLRESDQQPDFAGVVHPQFHHRHVCAMSQFEERQRQSQMVVQVPLVLRHLIPNREKRRQHLFRCRLTRAASDGDHGCAGCPSHVLAKRLQRNGRVLDLDQEPCAIDLDVRSTCNHGPACAERKRIGDKLVTVPRGDDREEEISCRQRSRVDREAVERQLRRSRQQPAIGGPRHLRSGQLQNGS